VARNATYPSLNSLLFGLIPGLQPRLLHKLLHTPSTSSGRSLLKSRPGGLDHVEIRAVRWPRHTLYLPTIVRRCLILMGMRWSVVFLYHTFIAINTLSPSIFLCKK
jgi:hypothetical protein